MNKPARITDEEMQPIVRAAAQGSALAKRQLVERTVPVVHGMLTRLVGRRHEIEDLVQQVFVRIFRSLSTFRGDAAFTTWVCTICVNVAASFWEDHKGKREAPLSLALVAQEGDTDARVMAREGLRQVASVLDSLSPHLRSAFVLHVFEGHSVEAVAAMTSRTVAATYKAIERARWSIEDAAAKNPHLAYYLNGGAQ